MVEHSRMNLHVWLLFQLARLANRWCGPAMLYWDDADLWDDYMSVGQSRVRMIPEFIFDDIDKLCDINPYSQTARRVRDWLWGDEVRIDLP